jgi:hypothetical protein
MLPREAKNVKFTYWGDSTHSFDDERGTNDLSIDKKMIRKAISDELDTHIEKLNSSSKIILSTRSGFNELDIPNYSSFSQIQGGMDEGKKKGKSNVCQVTTIVSPKKSRKSS